MTSLLSTRSFRRIALAALSVASLMFVGPSRGAEPKSASDAGWTNLLDKGQQSKHWTTKGNWQQGTDGASTLTPRKGEQGWSRFDAYLWSRKQYGDFQIEFEFDVKKGSNSGFYFRVGDEKDPVAKGIEVQIYDSYGKPADAKLTDHDCGGIIPGLPPTKNASKAPGEWNKMQITNQDDKLTVVLNGQTVNVVDLTKSPLNSRPKNGKIGFQDHALPLSIRNVRIREL